VRFTCQETYSGHISAVLIAKILKEKFICTEVRTLVGSTENMSKSFTVQLRGISTPCWGQPLWQQGEYGMEKLINYQMKKSLPDTLRSINNSHSFGKNIF
jgi:hypothetical protein